MRIHPRPLALFITLALLAITYAGGARAQCDSSHARLSAQGNERVFVGVAAARELVHADSLHRAPPGYPDYVVNGSGCSCEAGLRLPNAVSYHLEVTLCLEDDRSTESRTGSRGNLKVHDR